MLFSDFWRVNFIRSAKKKKMEKKSSHTTQQGFNGVVSSWSVSRAPSNMEGKKSCADEEIAPEPKSFILLSPLVCFLLVFLAHPSASDFLHRQPRAGPAGRLPAQLLRQRPGGIRDSQQQVVVRPTHGAPDPAWGPLREDHPGRQHWRDRAPWERYHLYPYSACSLMFDRVRTSDCISRWTESLWRHPLASEYSFRRLISRSAPS